MTECWHVGHEMSEIENLDQHVLFSPTPPQPEVHSNCPLAVVILPSPLGVYNMSFYQQKMDNGTCIRIKEIKKKQQSLDYWWSPTLVLLAFFLKTFDQNDG